MSTAYRYWRTTPLRACCLSAFWLLSGATRVDAAATLSASTGEDVSALQGATLATQVSLAKGTVLTWDFGDGGDVNVTDIRLGGGASAAAFLRAVGLQYSADGSTWVDQDTSFSGIQWPGAFTATTSVLRGNLYGSLPLIGYYGPTFPERLVAPYTTLSNIWWTNGVALLPRRRKGVWQVEVTVTTLKSSIRFGVMGSAAFLANVATYSGSVGAPSVATNALVYDSGGAVTLNGSTAATYTAMSTGSVVGMVVDLYAGTATFYLNGAALGSAISFSFSDFVMPFVGGSDPHVVVAYTELAVRTYGFTYPIAGADPWEGRTLILQGAGNFDARDAWVATAAATPAPSFASAPGIQATALDYYNQGAASQQTARVQGTVAVYDAAANLPLRRKVRLLRERDGKVIAEQWSDATTGAYDFKYIDSSERYTVISYDYEHNYRAVIADNLTPEAM
ncbi:MAG: hypothetical protein QM569_14930 [Acidovorax sp.]|uniref:SPRY domain-containing protein n=1 Tax=Acidovorax sp. TaxID=1872122 RepID=UPI0039E377F8